MSTPPLTDDQLKEISDAIIAGRKIDAIKQYREITGTGLAEAKQAIEEITSSLADEYPELAQKSSGCMSIIVLGMVSVYALYEHLPFV
ncbi:MAG: ribosomal protein L7/L12 [Verrucomicrobiota bacterium]